MGPGTRDKAGNTIPVAVKEGDTVLLPEYGGTQVKLGEKEYVPSLCHSITDRYVYLYIISMWNLLLM